MKISRLLPLLLVVIIFYPSITVAGDLNQLYSSNYDVFWKQWNKSKRGALACKDYHATAEFLSNALTTLGNAEVSQANSEVIEDLCLKKPKCILEALNKLKSPEQEKLYEFFISTPLFHESSEIKSALEKEWKQPRYEKAKNMYHKWEQKTNERIQGLR